MQILKAN